MIQFLKRTLMLHTFVGLSISRPQSEEVTAKVEYFIYHLVTQLKVLNGWNASKVDMYLVHLFYILHTKEWQITLLGKMCKIRAKLSQVENKLLRNGSCWKKFGTYSYIHTLVYYQSCVQQYFSCP